MSVRAVRIAHLAARVAGRVARAVVAADVVRFERIDDGLEERRQHGGIGPGLHAIHHAGRISERRDTGVALDAVAHQERGATGVATARVAGREPVIELRRVDALTADDGKLSPPSRGVPLLRKLYDRERSDRFRALDVRASMLAGLLPAAKDDQALLAMTERVLGNRNGAMRVYGALRAVALSASGHADWVRPHLYTELSLSKLSGPGPALVRAAAREAMEALGATAPEWEEGDEYASGVAPEALPNALLHRHKHRVKSVFERIYAQKVRHPDVLRYGGPVLEELLRYEADDPEYNNALGDAYRALTLQGAAAVPVFAHLLALDGSTPGTRTLLLLCLRALTSEVEVRAWLRAARRDQVLAQLHTPDPRFVPFLDLLAATAAVRWGLEARAAVSAAVKRRLELARGSGPGGFGDQDATLRVLPRVLASLGAEGLQEVKRLEEVASQGYLYDARSALGAAQAFTHVPEQRHSWKSPLTLRTILEDGHRPQLSLAVTLKDAEVTWSTRFDGLVFEFIVPNARLDASETVSFPTADAARAYAQELEETAMRQGYRASKTKA